VPSDPQNQVSRGSNPPITPFRLILAVPLMLAGPREGVRSGAGRRGDRARDVSGARRAPGAAAADPRVALKSTALATARTRRTGRCGSPGGPGPRRPAEAYGRLRRARRRGREARLSGSASGTQTVLQGSLGRSLAWSWWLPCLGGGSCSALYCRPAKPFHGSSSPQRCGYHYGSAGSDIVRPPCAAGVPAQPTRGPSLFRRPETGHPPREPVIGNDKSRSGARSSDTLSFDRRGNLGRDGPARLAGARAPALTREREAAQRTASST